jgi:ABC-type transport system substrate-binding protein
VAPQDFSVIEGGDTKVVDQVSVQSLRIHMNAGTAPFDDVRVRQAMNYGMDRETILATVLEGRGELMSQPAGPTIFGFNPDIKPYPYDPAKAQQLLAEAGYGPDNPAKVELQLQQDRFPGVQAVADAMVAQLNEVGFEVTATMNSSATFLDNFNSVGNGFMVISQEDNVTDLMPSNFSSLEDSYKRYNYANPEVDALIAQAQSEPDDAKREAIYRDLNQLLHDDAPWVFMWNPMDAYGINVAVTGFAPDGVGFFYFRDLAGA